MEPAYRSHAALQPVQGPRVNAGLDKWYRVASGRCSQPPSASPFRSERRSGKAFHHAAPCASPRPESRRYVPAPGPTAPRGCDHRWGRIRRVRHRLPATNRQALSRTAATRSRSQNALTHTAPGQRQRFLRYVGHQARRPHLSSAITNTTPSAISANPSSQ